MWLLPVLLLVGVTAATNSTINPRSMPTVPNSLPIGLTSVPPLGGLAGPYGLPIVGASGLGTGPRYGNTNLSKLRFRISLIANFNVYERYR